MRDDIHQRLLSASADHHNAGVRADPTAGEQGVQCRGKRGKERWEDPTHETQAEKANAVTLRLGRLRNAVPLHLALDLRLGDGPLAINAPPVPR